MKAIDKVYDFDDFVKNVGDVSVMQPDNFFNFEKGLSEGKKSKSMRLIFLSRR